MKLISFEDANGQTRVGASMNLVDVKSIGESAGEIYDITHIYPTMLDLIRGGSYALDEIRRAMRQHPPVADFSGNSILAPIPQPQRNIFCVGWNYLKHFNEGIGHRGDDERPLPSHPTFFSKSTLTVLSPEGTVPYDSSVTQNLDYEGEVAIIIGKQGINISASEAFQYVFGFSLANDISARDLQRQHGGQWLKGKSLDGTCPFGPSIITADEIDSVEDLTIRTYVNNELRQNATLHQLIFNISRLIEELSRGMTLLPGDILLTGTPEGVGSGRTPQVFLRPGDEMIIQSDQLGQLQNVVGQDRAL